MKKDIGTPDKDADTEGTDAPALHQSRHAGKLPSPPGSYYGRTGQFVLEATVPQRQHPAAYGKSVRRKRHREGGRRMKMNFSKDELAMVYQYAAGTKEETLAG